MREGKYMLETHAVGGIRAKEEFIGTRSAARTKCREIDNPPEGKIIGQTTHPRFIKYTECE